MSFFLKGSSRAEVLSNNKKSEFSSWLLRMILHWDGGKCGGIGKSWNDLGLGIRGEPFRHRRVTFLPEETGPKGWLWLSLWDGGGSVEDANCAICNKFLCWLLLWLLG